MIFCLPCLALLIYFCIAGIFVPRYRNYIKEGWKCFLDKLRGKICSVSFDNRMRIALSMWLARKGFVRLGRFFHNEKNFNIVLTITVVVFTIVSIYLFVLMIKFLVASPCAEEAGKCVFKI